VKTKIGKSEAPWILTTDEVDRFANAVGALDAAMVLIGADDDDLQRLLQPHVDSLNEINDRLYERSEKFRATAGAA